MKIGIIGTGYVGLVAGACLAETGNDVVCHDVDEDKVSRLRAGDVPIHEPGLEPLIRGNLAAGRLKFTTDGPGCVRRSDILFIAVGTPPDGDGAADLRNVVAVAQMIGRSMQGEKIVVTKSTVPVGTARLVRQNIEALTNHPVHVCSNPEFLKEGDAVNDFMKPDRVVLGVDSGYAADVLRNLYAPFVRTGRQIMTTDVASAEITKYAANSMLAARISFMNTIARLCQKAGADVEAVRLGLGSDPRIGPRFLFPGVGYGGSCFPKDVKALITTLQEAGVDASILEAVDSVNEKQKLTLLEWVDETLGKDLDGRTIAVWGLAFKPNTDDIREAPSLQTIAGLLQRGARIVAHDPVAMDATRKHFGDIDGIEYDDNAYGVLDGADALVVHTEWNPYRRPDFDRIRRSMARPLILDGRNLYDPELMTRLGFEYHSVGRSPTSAPRLVANIARAS